MVFACHSCHLQFWLMRLLFFAVFPLEGCSVGLRCIFLPLSLQPVPFEYFLRLTWGFFAFWLFYR